MPTRPGTPSTTPRPYMAPRPTTLTEAVRPSGAELQGQYTRPKERVMRARYPSTMPTPESMPSYEELRRQYELRRQNARPKERVMRARYPSTMPTPESMPSYEELRRQYELRSRNAPRNTPPQPQPTKVQPTPQSGGFVQQGVIALRNILDQATRYAEPYMAGMRIPGMSPQARPAIQTLDTQKLPSGVYSPDPYTESDEDRRSRQNELGDIFGATGGF